MTTLHLANYDSKIKNLIEKYTVEAEEVLHQQIPKCIGELDQLLKDERLNLSELEKIRVDSGIPIPFADKSTDANGAPASNKRKRTSSEADSGFNVETLKGGTKVLVLSCGSVNVNHHIQDLIKLIKPHILKLIENCSKLRMWIIFLIPKIEDGNNFGVDIQQDALEEIKLIENEASLYLEHVTRYFLTRGKAIAKIAKYPHIDDFRQVLREIDERQILDLRNCIEEMRNQYATIYDLINKNISKIKEPKGSNSNHNIMY